MEGSSSSGGSCIGNAAMAERVRALDLKCNHGLKAKVDVCKHGVNLGKLFLSCPLWNKTSSGYFRWVQDIVKEQSSTPATSMEECVPKSMDSSLVKLEVKYGRLKEKKSKLVAENEELKQQLVNMKHEREMSMERERVLHRLIYASWVLICIMVIMVAYQNHI